jgi:hypothetical protein
MATSKRSLSQLILIVVFYTLLEHELALTVIRDERPRCANYKQCHRNETNNFNRAAFPVLP